MKYACDLIEQTNARGLTCFPHPREQVKDTVARFKQLHESRVAKKSAKDLTVLFLPGPSPTNDLSVLTELGVAIQNIWAVESDDDAYKMAVESVSMDGSPLKLYRGSLQQFFETVPQQFDIVNSTLAALSPAASQTHCMSFANYSCARGSHRCQLSSRTSAKPTFVSLKMRRARSRRRHGHRGLEVGRSCVMNTKTLRRTTLSTFSKISPLTTATL